MAIAMGWLGERLWKLLGSMWLFYIIAQMEDLSVLCYWRLCLFRKEMQLIAITSRNSTLSKCWSPSQDSHSGPLNDQDPGLGILWPSIHYFLVRKKIHWTLSFPTLIKMTKATFSKSKGAKSAGTNSSFPPWPYHSNSFSFYIRYNLGLS
jgi:hypothetical protein